MIDFNLMVRNILWERTDQDSSAQPPASNPPVNTQTTPSDNNSGQQPDKKEEKEEQEESSSLIQSLKSNTSKLKTAWGNQFNKENYPFPSEPELTKLVYDTRSANVGRIKSAEGFSKIEINFPLIDLIAQLYELRFKSTVKEKEKVNEEQIYQAFYSKLKNVKRPLEYKPNSAWAATLKSDLISISQGELGKLRIDDPSMDDLSIYGVVFKLLALRKKVLLPFLSDFTKKFNGQAEIDKIMLQPWGLVSGSSPINNQKIKDLYDDVTVKEMVDISLAAYKLYQQQCRVHGLEETNYSQYPSFIGQKGAAPFQWLANNTTEETTQQINASFDVTLQRVYSILLSEMVSPSITAPYENRQSQNPEPEQTNSENSEPEQKEFQTKEGFLYSFTKIKEAANNFQNEEAASLVRELTNFANYIKTKEGGDILGGVSQLAKTTFGIKNMGS